jgi:hypothetical protein
MGQAVIHEDRLVSHPRISPLPLPWPVLIPRSNRDLSKTRSGQRSRPNNHTRRQFPGLHGYGATAEIAAAQGAEIIIHLVTGHLDAGRPLPEPRVLVKVA